MLDVSSKVTRREISDLEDLKICNLKVDVNELKREQPGSLSLPDESWWSGSGEEQPLSGLFVLSLLCFLFGTVTYTRTQTPTHTHTDE